MKCRMIKSNIIVKLPNINKMLSSRNKFPNINKMQSSCNDIIISQDFTKRSISFNVAYSKQLLIKFKYFPVTCIFSYSFLAQFPEFIPIRDS